MTQHSSDAAATSVDVRKATYRDSVGLMRVSKAVAAQEGVASALVAMATELNLDLLAGMGCQAPSGIGPNDLLIAVRARDDKTLKAALELANQELAAMSQGGSGGGTGTAEPPHTIRTALARAQSQGARPNLALISVPGPHAAAQAFDALEAGLDPMIFSDNVPLAHEVALKDAAARHGRLVMGPDCGTAVISGAGLGFANAVLPGPVGVVAASGTGAQALMCLLDAAGVGISHCLGVGGRDLSKAVGGRSTRRALELLDADPATERIVLVSKPPAPEVAKKVTEEAGRLATPVHTVFLGESGGSRTIADAAREVADALGRPAAPWPSRLPAEPLPGRPGALRGLFCGGTLADEAMLIASAQLGPIASNIALRPEWALDPETQEQGHVVIDFGDDEMTSGRPHPMIDPGQRDERFAAELADPSCGVVLLDVLIGHGSHPDPAAGIAARLRSARAAGCEVPVVVALCGTAQDHQGFAAQAEALTGAGAEVYLSNADAARRAVELIA